jgi:hypothetical protein
MSYEIREYGERELIIDNGTFPDSKQVTPNLTENEHKLIYLIAEDCPIHTNCIHLDFEVTSVCKYLGAFSEPSEPIPCKHKNSSGSQKLWKIRTEPHCKNIKLIVIPTRLKPDKSHAHVICDDN